MQEVLRSIGTQSTGVGAAMLTSVSIQPTTLAIFSYSPAFLRDLHRMVSPTVRGAQCLTAAPIPRHQLCRPPRLPHRPFGPELADVWFDIDHRRGVDCVQAFYLDRK